VVFVGAYVYWCASLLSRLVNSSAGSVVPPSDMSV